MTCLDNGSIDYITYGDASSSHPRTDHPSRKVLPLLDRMIFRSHRFVAFDDHSLEKASVLDGKSPEIVVENTTLLDVLDLQDRFLSATLQRCVVKGGCLLSQGRQIG